MKGWLLFLFLAFQSNLFPQISITGTVCGDSLGTPLPDTEISIPDLRITTISSGEGKFTFHGLPHTKAIVQFRRLGYKTLLIGISLERDTALFIRMEESAIEGHEVVITGNASTSDHEESSSPVYLLNKDELREDAPLNVIDALSKAPGVSQVSSGPFVSKPVIRGLSFNRVLVLHDGIRQEGQQWGDEHGVEIDANSTERIEILRGPASLLYGSDAMGGVINILEPFPAAWNSGEGEFSTEFHSNNRMGSGSMMLQGNREGWVWRIRGSNKNASCYSTPKEIVYNSLFNETAGSLMLGVHKKWGYSHLNVSDYLSNIGLMEGERDSATGSFTDQNGTIVGQDVLRGRKFNLPFQNVEHRKISSRTHLIGKESHFDILAGWQQNLRSEFESSTDTAALFFDLNTYTLDLNFHWPRSNGWEHVFGINSMYQLNRSGGEEILLPEYNMADAGLFYFLKKTGEKNTFSLGLRYSFRNLKIFEAPIDASGAPDPNGPFSLFNDSTHYFYGPSVSLGFTQRLKPHLSLKQSFSTGFRAPTAYEMYAFGVHEGTQRYEFGNASLKQEMSFQYDLGLIIEKKKIHWEPSLFMNMISNYISLLRLGNSYVIEDGDTLESFGFFQTTAVLYGGELMVDWHPMSHIHIRNIVSLVVGEDTRTTGALSMIPAPRIVTDIKYEFSDKRLEEKWREAYLKLSSDLNFEQYRIAFFEEPSELYCILHFGAGITRIVKGNEWKIRFNVQNLLNQEYAPHLSRMRYLGVKSIGRNFTFSLEIPFGLKKK